MQSQVLRHVHGGTIRTTAQQPSSVCLLPQEVRISRHLPMESPYLYSMMQHLDMVHQEQIHQRQPLQPQPLPSQVHQPLSLPVNLQHSRGAVLIAPVVPQVVRGPVRKQFRVPPWFHQQVLLPTHSSVPVPVATQQPRTSLSR